MCSYQRGLLAFTSQMLYKVTNGTGERILHWNNKKDIDKIDTNEINLIYSYF